MEKFRRVVGAILIITGVAIIGNVLYKKIITLQKQKEIAYLFENELSEGTSTGKENKNNSIDMDDVTGYTPIAKMEIPSIDLAQIVVEGISDDVLQYYLGHFTDSANPGEKGNFSVAGHRVSDYTDAFINLYKVAIGDEVIVTTKTNIYTYVVTESYIVEPEQVEVLDDTEEATITLITCTVGAKQRLVVKGTLEKTEEL